LESNVLKRKQDNDWSEESLKLTTQLLAINPEFYTVWNYRRHIFLKGIFPNSTPEQIHSHLASDLALTMAALRQHPKVYWIWNHRRWCLENVPEGPIDAPDDSQGWRKASWNKELYVVEKMLEADARNFHAWDYRRYILSSMPVTRTPADELSYTTKKIESNFSNFSAWHQRSKVYASLWESASADDVIRAKDNEFELVKQAMYTDPNDQSVWLYHRWLIGSGDDPVLLRREIDMIEELLELEPSSKWCLESLVHYKQLLLKHKRDEALIAECVTALTTLETIDPHRRQRYRDLAARAVVLA